MAHQIVTANRLIDGGVVYFTADGWSSWIADARVMEDEQSALATLELGHESVRRNEVVEPYLIDVVQEAATIKPVRYREIIRAKGPSTLPRETPPTTGELSMGAVTGSTTVTTAFLNGV